MASYPNLQNDDDVRTIVGKLIAREQTKKDRLLLEPRKETEATQKEKSENVIYFLLVKQRSQNWCFRPPARGDKPFVIGVNFDFGLQAVR